MALKIDNLNYSVSSKALLADIHIAVNEPKIIGIIGANGAGKSTLLNCMSGLLPTKQSILLNNQWLENYTNLELASHRAALPQQSKLNFPFQVSDVVAMSFAYQSLDKSEQEELIEYCLDKMSASHLKDRNYLNLSGGEKQRVQIARVWAQLLSQKDINQLRFLYLDEPTAPLDLKHQFQLFDHLTELKQQNIAVITVLHDLNLAASYCDEIWVISNGQMVTKGSPAEVISKQMLKQVYDVDLDVVVERNVPQIRRVTN